jgi:hypothetical protein
VVAKSNGRETAMDAMLKARTTAMRKESLELEAIVEMRRSTDRGRDDDEL